MTRAEFNAAVRTAARNANRINGAQPVRMDDDDATIIGYVQRIKPDGTEAAATGPCSFLWWPNVRGRAPQNARTVPAVIRAAYGTLILFKPELYPGRRPTLHRARTVQHD